MVVGLLDLSSKGSHLILVCQGRHLLEGGRGQSIGRSSGSVGDMSLEGLLQLCDGGNGPGWVEDSPEPDSKERLDVHPAREVESEDHPVVVEGDDGLVDVGLLGGHLISISLGGLVSKLDVRPAEVWQE